MSIADDSPPVVSSRSVTVTSDPSFTNCPPPTYCNNLFPLVYMHSLMTPLAMISMVILMVLYSVCQSWNPAYTFWIRQDKLILNVILASLPKEISHFVTTTQTSLEAWDTLTLYLLALVFLVYEKGLLDPKILNTYLPLTHIIIY